MNLSKNKSRISTIILILVLSFASSLVALPIISAQNFEIDTFAYLAVVPDIIGIGQQVRGTMWLFLL